MSQHPSNVLRLDKIVTDGIDGDDFKWIISRNHEVPYIVAAPRVDGWARLGLLEVLDLYATRRAGTCIHAPRFARQAVVVASPVRPRLVVCDRCEVPRLHRPQDEPKWRVCELCGGEATQVWSIVFGVVNYRVPTCVNCAPEAS